MVSLDEAGNTLTTFTAFPVAQWRCLRTTNAIERIFTEFPAADEDAGRAADAGGNPDGAAGDTGDGGIRLRKLHGYQAITDTTLHQAA